MAQAQRKTDNVVDFFKGATTTVSTPSTKKKGKAVKYLVKGLMDYVSLAIVERRSKKEKEDLGEILREQIIGMFVDQGCAIKAKPENFQGTEDVSTASIELKVRSATLDEDEQKLLRLHAIPMVDVGVPASLRINPDYMTDLELLKKVNDALLKVPGLPRDFIQPVAATVAVVPAPNAHDVVFKRKPETVKKLFPVLFTLAISQTKIDDTKIALGKVTAYLGLDKKEA